MKKNVLLYGLIIVLVALQVYTIRQNNNLESTLKQLEHRIGDYEDGLSRSISELDGKLAETTSLILSSSYEMGEFNPETLKVPVTFTVQPKTMTDETVVFLNFDDEKIPMERQTIGFVLTKDFTIDEELSPTIVLEENGILQVQESENLKVYQIKDQIFSSLSPQFEGETGYKAQEPYDFYLNGNIKIKYDYYRNENGFKDIKFIATLDHEVVKTYPMDFSHQGYVEINEKFKMKTGQNLIIKVVAQDEYNFTYEYVLIDYVAGEDEEPGVYYLNEKIITSKGEVIYDFNEFETKLQ